MNKMKHKILLLLALCCWAQIGAAQSPKWLSKAKQAVLSIVTYDADGNILHSGNGFFVSEDGVAVSDYTLFRGAERAVAIDSEGRQMPVDRIMGADDMYDVAKFRVDISSRKKNVALPLSSSAPAVGTEIYLLPYSSKKERTYVAGTVKAVDKVGGNYSYYTLNMPLKASQVSCPIMNAAGEVFGLAQLSSGADTATVCYAVDASYAMARSITALSFNDNALRSIGIQKALPDTEEQAEAFVMMVSTQSSPEAYSAILDDFIRLYPDNTEGYLRRAANRLELAPTQQDMQQVEEDLDKALELSEQKDEAYFNRAKLIYNYMLERPDTLYAGWSYDRALDEIRQAIALRSLPVYEQLEGDILFAKQDYPNALLCYERVNASALASPATFYSAARTKQLADAPAEEVLALLDSCVVRFHQPYEIDAAPYLLERAQLRVQAGLGRGALLDYDAYFDAVKGEVNDVFYYLRQQAAVVARQYQRALDDLAKAISLAPDNMTYRAELAVLNMRIGRSDEAVRVLKEALAANPSYAEGYRLLGNAYIQLKDNAAACDAFHKAKNLGDQFVDDLIDKYCQQ